MKRKELKRLAEKIARNELILQDETSDKEAKRRAENEILELSGHVSSLEDMMVIDELV